MIAFDGRLRTFMPVSEITNALPWKQVALASSYHSPPAHFGLDDGRYCILKDFLRSQRFAPTVLPGPTSYRLNVSGTVKYRFIFGRPDSQLPSTQLPRWHAQLLITSFRFRLLRPLPANSTSPPNWEVE